MSSNVALGGSMLLSHCPDRDELPLYAGEAARG